MNSVGGSYLLSQLGHQGPALLVYVFAVFMAAINFQRAKVPSILTLIGVAISVMATVVVLALQFTLITNRNQMNEYLSFIQVGFVLGSCVKAVGLGFIVAAIFAGRTQPSSDRYLRNSP